MPNFTFSQLQKRESISSTDGKPRSSQCDPGSPDVNGFSANLLIDSTGILNLLSNNAPFSNKRRLLLFSPARLNQAGFVLNKSIAIESGPEARRRSI